MPKLAPIVLVLLFVGVGGFAGAEEIPAEPVIDSIEIHNFNIYDTSNPEYRHWIFSLANRLHIPTRKLVIKRELLLDKGDRFNRDLAEETAHNLRTLSFIWNARTELVGGADGSNILRVSTVDRWSLSGGPSIDRSSGETTYKIGALEANFLGFGQTVAFDYFFRDYDEDYYVAWFYDRRIFGRKLSLNLFANDDPEIGTKSITLSRPYYSLTSNHTFSIDFTGYDYRNDHYREGIIVGREWIEGSKVSLSGARRWGTYHTKVYFGAGYTYADLEDMDTVVYYDGADVVFALDSVYHYGELFIGFQDIRYIKANRIDMFTRDEDITIIKGLTFLYGRTWETGSGARMHDVRGVSGNYGFYYRSNLILLEGFARRWFHHDKTSRKKLDILAKYYNNALSWYTLAVHVRHARDTRLDGQKELYLGENKGIRGYPRNYSNGEKYLVVNVENRFFTNVRFPGGRISPVQFIDLGSTWNRGEYFDVRHMEWSVGVGLRISTERLTSRESARIDVAYAGRLKTWQVSFGLGQYLN